MVAQIIAQSYYGQELIVIPHWANIQPMASENERQTFTRRLNEALDDAGAPPKNEGRQAWVAKQFGVSDVAAFKWMSGATMPRMEKIQRIAERAKVRAEWLQFGVEPKRQEITLHPYRIAEGVADEPLTPGRKATPEQMQWIDLLESLNGEDRTAVLRIARALAATSKEDV